MLSRPPASSLGRSPSPFCHQPSEIGGPFVTNSLATPSTKLWAMGPLRASMATSGLLARSLLVTMACIAHLALASHCPGTVLPDGYPLTVPFCDGTVGYCKYRCCSGHLCIPCGCTANSLGLSAVCGAIMQASSDAGFCMGVFKAYNQSKGRMSLCARDFVDKIFNNFGCWEFVPPPPLNQSTPAPTGTPTPTTTTSPAQLLVPPPPALTPTPTNASAPALAPPPSTGLAGKSAGQSAADWITANASQPAGIAICAVLAIVLAAVATGCVIRFACGPGSGQTRTTNIYHHSFNTSGTGSPSAGGPSAAALPRPQRTPDRAPSWDASAPYMTKGGPPYRVPPSYY